MSLNPKQAKVLQKKNSNLIQSIGLDIMGITELSNMHASSKNNGRAFASVKLP
jgi:hypothetical protein